MSMWGRALVGEWMFRASDRGSSSSQLERARLQVSTHNLLLFFVSPYVTYSSCPLYIWEINLDAISSISAVTKTYSQSIHDPFAYHHQLDGVHKGCAEQ